MRRLVLGLAALSATLFVAFPAHAQEDGSGFTGNINLFLGAKALDENDWAPWDEQSEVGLVADFGGVSWPVSLEIRILSSESDEDPFFLITGKTTELDLGVRKTWGAYNMHPYIGGGLASIEAELDDGFTTVSGSGTGLWVGGGIYWVLGRHFNLGFDAMISSADVTILGVDVNAGGGHFNFLLGYHF